MTIHERNIASYPPPTRNQIRRDAAATANASLRPGGMAVSYASKRLSVGVDPSVDPSGLLSFLASAELAATYLTQASAAATYLTQANAAATYLTQANAAATYLTQANAAATYLTQANAAATYLTPVQGDARYLTPGQANGLYLPLAGGTLTGPLGINVAPSAANVLNMQATQNAPVYAQLKNTAVNASASAAFVAYSDSGNFAMLRQYSTALGVAGIFRGDGALLYASGAGGLTLATAAAQPLYFVTNNVEVGRFAANGFFGIGTNNPGALLDVGGNVNADGGVVGRVKNASNGANASTYFAVQNDLGNGVTLGTYSSGHPITGTQIGYTADGCVIATQCAGGMAIGMQSGNGALALMTNGVFQFVISPAGGVTMDQYTNPGVDGSAITIKNRATTGYAQVVLYNDVNLFQMSYLGSAYGGSGLAKPDQMMFASRGAQGMLFNTYVDAPIVFGIASQFVAGFNKTNGYLGLGPLLGGPNNARYMIDALENKNGATAIYLGNGSGAASAQCGFQCYTTNSTASLMITGPNFTAAGSPYAPDMGYLTSGNAAAGLLIITQKFQAPIRFNVGGTGGYVATFNETAAGYPWYVFRCDGAATQMASYCFGIQYDNRYASGLCLSDAASGYSWVLGPSVGSGANDGHFNIYSHNNARLTFSLDWSWGAIILPNMTLTTASAANCWFNTANAYIYYSTSSLKYKADLEAITVDEAKEVINKLRPFSYRSLGPLDDQDRRFVGLGAEDLDVIDPRLVSYGKDGPENVMYDRLAAIEAVVLQDLMKRVAALEKRTRH